MSRFTAAIIPALLLITAGCSDVRPTYTGRADPYSARQIQFTSQDLQNDTAISGAPIVSRDPSGYLHVTVAIRSAVDHDLHVDYQTRFFDASGAVIETTEWHAVTLPANSPDSVEDVCTSPAAANFQTTFRFSK